MVRDMRGVTLGNRKGTRSLEAAARGTRRRDWQEDRKKDTWKSSERRPTMHSASLDIKSPSDVARPKLIARMLESKVHMGGLLQPCYGKWNFEGHAPFEEVLKLAKPTTSHGPWLSHTAV